jgi:hypothetical protein
LCLAICFNGNKNRLPHNFNPSLRFLRIYLLAGLNVQYYLYGGPIDGCQFARKEYRAQC